MRRSILTEKIARRGYHIYREYGIDPLERHFVEEVMTRKVETIDADMPVAEVLAKYFGEKQRHRAFPVTRDGALVGMIERDGFIARTGNPAIHVMSDLFGANTPIIALPRETCRIASNRLAVHGLERLPVVSDPQSRHLVGLISRSDLVKPSLAFFEEEEHRELFRRSPLRHLKKRFAPVPRHKDDAIRERP